MAQNPEAQMTLEQIEAHIKDANLEDFNKQAAPGQAGAQQDLAGQLARVCGVYRGVRPILSVVQSFPLLPGSVKSAVGTFVSVMNTICP
ncbi:MAG: hypothetical protein ABIN89_00495 [Chitinophagaceae bacterium]